MEGKTEKHAGYLGHIIPIKTYLWIYAGLLILLFLTFEVANYDFGKFNTIVAMTIAAVKTLLVVLFFMHVKYSSKLTRFFVILGFTWLIVLFALTLGDYFAHQFTQVQGWE